MSASRGRIRRELDYWKRMEFTPEQWHGLAAHVREQGLVFLSSAFSLAAVELLKGIGVAAWKIGSGEFASCELWEAMMAAPAPILFSTGLAKRAEIRDAADLFRSKTLPFALFQCTTAYPSPLEMIGLNVMDELRREFAVPLACRITVVASFQALPPLPAARTFSKCT